jgi:hypothetical protein
MIPKIFHFVWITKDFMNERNNILPCHDITIRSFKVNNPDFDIMIWNNKKISELVSKMDKKLLDLILNEKTLLAQKTDILRMYILNMYGGIYSDLDVICINSFDDLLNNNFFVGEEKSKDRTHMNAIIQVAHDKHYINNTVIGSEKDSCVINKYFELLFKTKNIFRISYGPNLVETTLGNNEVVGTYTILSDDYFFVKNYFEDFDMNNLTSNSKIIHFYGGTSKDGI